MEKRQNKLNCLFFFASILYFIFRNVIFEYNVHHECTSERHQKQTLSQVTFLKTFFAFFHAFVLLSMKMLSN